MSISYCDVCKTKPARIQIIGEGKYCLSCHNIKMLGRYAREKTILHPESIAVTEPDGTSHIFQLEQIILGNKLIREAREQGGWYHFHDISDLEENAVAAEIRFLQKILDGVSTKSLEESNVMADNLLTRNQKSILLKDKGTIHILEDPDCASGTSFEIDGKLFSAEDLAKLLGACHGFALQYRIVDESEPVLKEDEYLVPEEITERSLAEELTQAVLTHTKHGFVSYKDVSSFDEVLEPILDKLEVLTQVRKIEEAMSFGKSLVRVLRDIETDDDFFPEYHLQQIESIFEPFGPDKELAELLRSCCDR